MQKKTTPVPFTFAETLCMLAIHFSLSKVFDDFLTMAIAALTQNPDTARSWYEDEYETIIASYAHLDNRKLFPEAFARLVLEMEDRLHTGTGNDVLGDFFEQHITRGRNGQFFTPYPVCEFMARVNKPIPLGNNPDQPQKILDPACGSGRMLLAARKVFGIGHHFYGIDIDLCCVKMAALNLFLNGMWGSEVLCANSLRRDDFVISYRISFLPLGIFKVLKKEDSLLWQMHQQSFPQHTVSTENPPQQPAASIAISKPGSASQLVLF